MKRAFIFPGQGSQYPGMAKDFYENFKEAKEVFDEADDILKRKLTSIIFDGPGPLLTETKNSQVAIFVVSMAILRVLEKNAPQYTPFATAGLSLGEYTAIAASKRLDFATTLQLVQQRGHFMNEACEKHPGTMAVILGLTAEQVEEMVKELNIPQDLWAANFNCPGQVVISGSLKGVEKGMEMAKAKGAKRALPLDVHGAFHSGLMQSAENKLREFIEQANIKDSSIKLVMNVPGTFVEDIPDIKKNLIKQVTHPVRWQQSIEALKAAGVEEFIEIGCGKSLSGLNRKTVPDCKTISIEKINDLDLL